MADKIGATKVADAVVRTVFPIPRNLCVANVSWSLLPYEADLLVMTGSGYLIEVEVKISLSDLKRDASKSKWHSDAFNNLISRFYYAIPKVLWEKASTRDHIRPGAGVIIADGPDPLGYFARIEIEADRNMRARPLTQRQQFDLARVGSYRAWSPQQRHRQRQLRAEHAMEERKRQQRWADWMKEHEAKPA